MGSILAFGTRERWTRGRAPAASGTVTRAAPEPGDLVRRIEQGDPAAEQELVELYGEGLTFLLRRWTRDREAAADLYQETIRRVLEKLRRGELRDPHSLPAFLHGLARNLSIDHYRRDARRLARERPIADTFDVPDQATGQLGALLRQEKIALVHRLLAELPRQRDREVLLRFYLEEEDRESIQADLGLTRAELNLVLFRARRRCQVLFEEALAGHGGRLRPH
jgi:RNA polymerase sigma-70 factor (ECF subfamily)